ncbi:MAG: hypothetical protein VX475_11850 [Myxococcota bacterium]|nr:hypothetical protein [Myxococcota bacterium]
MLGFHDIIQAYWVRLTGKFVMFSGRDMALLEDWRSQGATAASVCRGIRDAVMWMHQQDPPRDLYNCRTYIEPHVERARSRTILGAEGVSVLDTARASEKPRVAAGARRHPPARERALDISERAGASCKRDELRTIYRHAWYHVRGLGADLDLDEQYRALLELEEMIAEQFFELLPEPVRKKIEIEIVQEATSLGLRMSEDGWVHHIAARRRFLLARDHGLISLLD